MVRPRVSCSKVLIAHEHTIRGPLYLKARLRIRETSVPLRNPLLEPRKYFGSRPTGYSTRLGIHRHRTGSYLGKLTCLLPRETWSLVCKYEKVILPNLILNLQPFQETGPITKSSWAGFRLDLFRLIMGSTTTYPNVACDDHMLSGHNP